MYSEKVGPVRTPLTWDYSFDGEVSDLRTQRKEIVGVMGMGEIREAAWRRGI